MDLLLHCSYGRLRDTFFMLIDIQRMNQRPASVAGSSPLLTLRVKHDYAQDETLYIWTWTYKGGRGRAANHGGRELSELRAAPGLSGIIRGGKGSERPGGWPGSGRGRAGRGWAAFDQRLTCWGRIADGPGRSRVGRSPLGRVTRPLLPRCMEWHAA
ncbi:hypothetical protein NDU88_001834 [Pleurodeles waltl]|uniref:Uncharacterized protein n=1 Tax=Pleurodeles waltl TaxID=8319 RepID=A0AAV7P942_PLEWA|nr:hypothetical protein NDU88_001834 [Pleurodeles waltl]